MADTRRQILLTIKEQIMLLKDPSSPLRPGSPQDHRWSQQQWHEGFTFLVGCVVPATWKRGHQRHFKAIPQPTHCLLSWGGTATKDQGPPRVAPLQFVSHSDAGRHQHQDDLLFFVKHRTPAATSQQVFVRRRAKQLPEELQLTGRDFSSVDWAQTLQLNLVLHSQYQLTVVACRWVSQLAGPAVTSWGWVGLRQAEYCLHPPSLTHTHPHPTAGHLWQFSRVLTACMSVQSQAVHRRCCMTL
jgi:hypothetical protein